MTPVAVGRSTSPPPTVVIRQLPDNSCNLLNVALGVMEIEPRMARMTRIEEGMTGANPKFERGARGQSHAPYSTDSPNAHLSWRANSLVTIRRWAHALEYSRKPATDPWIGV